MAWGPSRVGIPAVSLRVSAHPFFRTDRAVPTRLQEIQKAVDRLWSGSWELNPAWGQPWSLHSSKVLRMIRQSRSGCRPLRQGPEGRQAVAQRGHRWVSVWAFRPGLILGPQESPSCLWLQLSPERAGFGSVSPLPRVERARQSLKDQEMCWQ